MDILREAKNIDERSWILICLREISITNSPRDSRREVIRNSAFHYIIHTTAYSVMLLKKIKGKKNGKNVTRYFWVSRQTATANYSQKNSVHATSECILVSVYHILLFHFAHLSFQVQIRIYYLHKTTRINFFSSDRFIGKFLYSELTRVYRKLSMYIESSQLSFLHGLPRSPIRL